MNEYFSQPLIPVILKFRFVTLSVQPSQPVVSNIPE